MKSPFLPILLTLGLFAGGCSLPQAQPDPTRYFVLTTPAASTAGAGKTVVGLRPVEVASYLRSRSMIVRKGTNEIEFRDFARWGESLDAGLTRALKDNLAASGAISQVLATPFALDIERDYDVVVRVLACEGGVDGSVIFRASWELLSTGAGADIVGRGDFTAKDLKWDGATEASLAAGLSQAVTALSAEIAAAVEKQ